MAAMSARPSAAPPMPPSSPMAADSMTNMVRICERRTPTASIVPTSRTRS